MLLVAQDGGRRSEAERLCDELTAQLLRQNRDYRAARKAVTDADAYRQAIAAGDRAKAAALLAGVARPDLAALGRQAMQHAHRFEGDDRLRLLTWAATNSGEREIVTEVVAEVRRAHMQSPLLVALLEEAMSLSRAVGQEEGARFLAEVVAGSPHAAVRAWAMYWQAVALQRDRDAPAARKALAERLLADAERLAAGTDLADRIAGPRFVEERLQVGMVAPDIVGEDLDGVPFRLRDYRGKVVVLDFWGFW